MIPTNISMQFRCGYGAPITCSMTNGSSPLTVTGSVPLTFNPDDAPLLPGETGLSISVPRGDASSGTFNTFVASVDGSGKTTLAASPQATVSNVPGWAGLPVPAVITTAIKMLAELCYEDGGCDDVPIPRGIEAFLDPYRNLVA